MVVVGWDKFNGSHVPSSCYYSIVKLESDYCWTKALIFSPSLTERHDSHSTRSFLGSPIACPFGTGKEQNPSSCDPKEILDAIAGSWDGYDRRRKIWEMVWSERCVIHHRYTLWYGNKRSLWQCPKISLSLLKTTYLYIISANTLKAAGDYDIADLFILPQRSNWNHFISHLKAWRD